MVIPIYVCRVSKIDYLEYVRKAGRTAAVALASLALPALLAARFAAPDYKLLFILGVVSVILYIPPTWMFGFTASEGRTLLRVVWPGGSLGQRERGNARVAS